MGKIDSMLKSCFLNRFAIALPLVMLCAASANADIPTLEMTMQQSQEHANSNSGQLKARQSQYSSSLSQADSAHSRILPSLKLNAQYFYQTNIPTLALNGQSFPFAYRNNYTIGPTLSYTLFDAGQIIDGYKSAKSSAKAYGENFKATRRQLTMGVKEAYSSVQLGMKNVALTIAALKLSQAQSHDIDMRLNAGTVSRLDQIQAHKETLTYALRLRSAQNSLAGSLRDLFALIGSEVSYDTTRPIPAESLGQLPKDVEDPTMIVKFETLEQTLASFDSLRPAAPDDRLPQIRALAYNAEAARYRADSSLAGFWPTVTVSATSELVYPDAILPKEANNNIFMIQLSLPIFNGQQTQSDADQAKSLAHAAEYQRDQTRLDSLRDFNKAKDTIASLQTQKKINDQNVKESTEIADLTYRSYRAGTRTFLDVESANQLKLQAEVDAAVTQQQLLVQYATLESLSSNVE